MTKVRSKTPVVLSPRKQDCENRLTTKAARKIVREHYLDEEAPYKDVWDAIDECAPTNVSASPSMKFFDPILGGKRKRKRKRTR